MSIFTDLNPTALAVKALVVVVVVGGAYTLGHHQGYKGEKLVYENYVLQQKDAAQQQAIANKTALDAQKAAYDAQVQSIQSEYTENAQHLQTARDFALASAASYADKLRLYLASSHAVAKQPVVPGATPGAEGASAVVQSSTGLLDGVSSLNWYLTQRFSDADKNAIALNEAIDRIDLDIKTCNGSLPGVTGVSQ